MKNITNHLGQIIAALAAVALLITAVVLFQAPVGGFFGDIVETETALGDKIVTNLDNVDLTNFGASAGAAGGGAGLPAVPPDVSTPGSVIPEGGIYLTGVSLNNMTWEYTTRLNAGQSMPATISACDFFIFGDYIYMYKGNIVYYDCPFILTVDGMQFRACENSNVEGWSVYAINKDQTVYGSILENINGENITTMSDTFYNSSLTTAPAIPNGVTSICQAFNDCTSLSSVPTIPSGVKDWSYAFRGCTSLSEVAYQGSVAEWNNLSYADKYDWRSSSGITKLMCSDGVITNF